MNEENINELNNDRLIHKQQKLIFLLGYSMSFLDSIKNYMGEQDVLKIKWLQNCVEKTIYGNEKWESFP